MYQRPTYKRVPAAQIIREMYREQEETEAQEYERLNQMVRDTIQSVDDVVGRELWDREVRWS